MASCSARIDTSGTVRLPMRRYLRSRSSKGWFREQEEAVISLTRRMRRGGEDRQASAAPSDQLVEHASEADRKILKQALPYSMTGGPRMLALIDAVRYCVAREIPGAFVECGVWRGGSVLAMILTLQE